MFELDRSITEVLEPHEMPKHAELNYGNVPKQHQSDSQWRQNGTWLRCISCQDTHGVHVDPNMIYSGQTDERGMPILQKRY